MLVIDASAMLEMLLGTSLARPAIERTLLAGETLHAPFLIDVEVTSGLRRHVHAHALTPADGARRLDEFLAFNIERHAHAMLLPRAWALRTQLSTYDAMYVALAEGLECPLLTSDGRVARSTGHRATIETLA